MTKANQDIRDAIQNAGIRHWQIAEATYTQAEAFSKKLRFELPDTEKVEIYAAINALVAEKSEVAK